MDVIVNGIVRRQAAVGNVVTDRYVAIRKPSTELEYRGSNAFESPLRDRPVFMEDPGHWLGTAKRVLA